MFHDLKDMMLATKTKAAVMLMDEVGGSQYSCHGFVVWPCC